MRAFLHAADRPWAITKPALEQILQIAARDNPDPDAVAAKLGRPLQNTRTVENRDGIAIIPITGPIFPRANLFTEVSGATSVQVLATDFTTALNDPAISAIVFDIDSPGGELAGINEASQMIFDARGTKPMVAYVGAQAASGGYWFACAADEIVVEETALLGSIGTVCSMTDTTARDAAEGVKHYDIVSSQSPLKRAGPETDAGRAQLQGILDSLADVFIGAVARNRNTGTADVLANFGQGGQLVGQHAVDAGMADRLGSLEGVIADLSKGASGTPALPQNLGGPAATSKGRRMKTPKVAGETADPKLKGAADPEDSDQVRCPNCGTMFDPSENAASDPTHVSALTTAAITGERARIAAITGCEEAKGRENLARTIALETDTTPAAAAKLLASAPIAVIAPVNPLVAAMSGVKNPNIGTGETEKPNDDQAEVAAIIGVFNSLKGAK